MSIATEISRLQSAKENIKTAIEAKGVTVPSDATLDTYDTYVDQISGGDNYLESYANGSLSGAITSAQLGTNIGSTMVNYLFYSQSGITSVDLTGTGATKISNYFCKNCSNLNSVILPSSVTEIGNEFCYVSGLATINIPNSVTKIGTSFASQTKLQALTIPSSITFIDRNCLYKCESLTQLVYNAQTTSITVGFCQNTNALALVDLNSSVSSIANNCFTANMASTDLLEVVLRKTDGIVKLSNEFGYSSYKNRHNVKIYVPSALISSYRADSNWAEGVINGYLTIEALEGSQYE